LGKIAVELEQALARRAAAGGPGRAAGRPLASGTGWSVDDVLCTFGPADRPFVERHSAVSIGVVLAGTFQYRSTLGRETLTPGSILLCPSGHDFECGHEHGAGDRCVAFRYAPEHFDRLAADHRIPRGQRRFHTPRVPPVRAAAALVARIAHGVTAAERVAWEEVAIEVAATAVRLANGVPADRSSANAGLMARVSEGVRCIERDPGAGWSLSRLAADAGLSSFYYLRAFRQVTGVTPHQFILRARLRQAAARLAREGTKVIDIALDAGFGDVSNFNRAFRAEFGHAPLAYRRPSTLEPATTSQGPLP
jgi:AraC family transcriptional regulator